MSLILHIGFPKTGTTTIQRAFKKNAKALEKYGIIYPVASGIKQSAVKHILAKNSNDNQKILEILNEVLRDLKNYELEYRISELESKFSKDLSEDTFNELKELKKLQNIN